MKDILNEYPEIESKLPDIIKTYKKKYFEKIDIKFILLIIIICFNLKSILVLYFNLQSFYYSMNKYIRFNEDSDNYCKFKYIIIFTALIFFCIINSALYICKNQSIKIKFKSFFIINKIIIFTQIKYYVLTILIFKYYYYILELTNNTLYVCFTFKFYYFLLINNTLQLLSSLSLFFMILLVLYLYEYNNVIYFYDLVINNEVIKYSKINIVNNSNKDNNNNNYNTNNFSKIINIINKIFCILINNNNTLSNYFNTNSIEYMLLHKKIFQDLLMFMLIYALNSIKNNCNNLNSINRTDFSMLILDFNLLYDLLIFFINNIVKNTYIKLSDKYLLYLNKYKYSFEVLYSFLQESNSSIFLAKSSGIFFINSNSQALIKNSTCHEIKVNESNNLIYKIEQK